MYFLFMLQTPADVFIIYVTDPRLMYLLFSIHVTDPADVVDGQIDLPNSAAQLFAQGAGTNTLMSNIPVNTIHNMIHNKLT